MRANSLNYIFASSILSRNEYLIHYLHLSTKRISNLGSVGEIFLPFLTRKRHLDFNCNGLDFSRLGMSGLGLHRSFNARYLEGRHQHLALITLPEFTFHSSYEEMAKVMSEMHAAHEVTERAPPAPPGWESGRGLAATYVGENQKLSQLILDFRVKKISALIEQGKPEAEATQEVNQTYVRYCSNGNKGKETWYISPQGITELEAAGKLRPLTEKPSPEPPSI